jgi:hypothetical protein
VVFGFQAVKAFVDLIEMDVQPPFKSAHAVVHDALDVRKDDLAVEARQDREEVVGRGPYPTAGPVV